MKYYSELTKQLYETEEAAKKAERDLEATKAKNAELAKAKKQEATKVEDAFKARNAARREYNTKLVEARKIYNDAIIAAKQAFNETLTTATDAKDKAEEAYNTALKEFTAKYESYHMTLKDGDNVVTISNASDKNFEAMGKEFNSFLDSLLNIWKL